MMAFGVTDKELVKYLLLYPLNLQQTHDNKLHVILLNSLSLTLRKTTLSRGICYYPGGLASTSHAAEKQGIRLMPAEPDLQSLSPAEVVQQLPSACAPVMFFSSFRTFAEIRRELEESHLTSCHTELCPSY